MAHLSDLFYLTLQWNIGSKCLLNNRMNSSIQCLTHCTFILEYKHMFRILRVSIHGDHELQFAAHFYFIQHHYFRPMHVRLHILVNTTHACSSHTKLYSLHLLNHSNLVGHHNISHLHFSLSLNICHPLDVLSHSQPSNMLEVHSPNKI